MLGSVASSVSDAVSQIRVSWSRQPTETNRRSCSRLRSVAQSFLSAFVLDDRYSTASAATLTTTSAMKAAAEMASARCRRVQCASIAGSE